VFEPRILVTNDDGINAPGLAVAEKIARSISDDVWVVAPESEQSGASHSLTLTVPLRLRKIGDKRFAVTGTPTDCVMMGVAEILKDKPPALLLSGVNRGSNLADDVTYSGTIAGAMEGTALGIASIALSQSYNFAEKKDFNWGCGEKHGPGVVKKLIEIGWPEDVLINVNFPDCPAEEVGGMEVAAQGKRDLNMATLDRRTDMRGIPYYWIGFKRTRTEALEGTDLRAVQKKNIAITPLHLNLTEFKVMETLRQQLQTAAGRKAAHKGKEHAGN
jgi:5'-nucleotidase